VGRSAVESPSSKRKGTNIVLACLKKFIDANKKHKKQRAFRATSILFGLFDD
jgi:hypothetical protein